MYCSTLSKQFITCLFLMLRKCFPTQRLSLYYTLPLGDTAFFEDPQGSEVHVYMSAHVKKGSHILFYRRISNLPKYLQFSSLHFFSPKIFFSVLLVDPHPSIFPQRHFSFIPQELSHVFQSLFSYKKTFFSLSLHCTNTILSSDWDPNFILFIFCL